jgi:hypothetical protein
MPNKFVSHRLSAYIGFKFQAIYRFSYAFLYPPVSDSQ